jgi:hypothetical protein
MTTGAPRIKRKMRWRDTRLGAGGDRQAGKVEAKGEGCGRIRVV